MADLAKPFVPTVWPQDKLSPPSGYSNLPKIDVLNAKGVKREYFVYSTSFPNINVFGDNVSTIPIGNDADFWYAQMTALLINNTTGLPEINFGIQLSVKDINSGFQQFNPWIDADMLNPNTTFSKDAVFGNIAGETIQPNYCVRGGGVEIRTVGRTVTGALADQYSLYVSLIGWKEYQYVAT